MKIIHISAECYPAAKVGGLADVVGALPKYQKKMGHEAMVVMPHYYTKFRAENQYIQVHAGIAHLGNVPYDYHFQIFRLNKDDLGYDLYSIDIPGLFDRGDIYSYHDDKERFLVFQVAALNWINSFKELPDIIHCHDQQSGFVPFFMTKVWAYRRLKEIPTIFTIHNGEYQGQFLFDRIHLLPGFDPYFNGQIEWDGFINPMATGVKNAWRVTTVSPNYMEEARHFMAGLERLLEFERGKSLGILNGIDAEVWNPATDKMLVKNYSTNLNAIEEGKMANKKWLCNEFNMDPEKPLFAFIGRLVKEKGADLLPEAVSKVLSESWGEQNILILGSGDVQLQNAFWGMENHFKGNYCSYIGYNEQLSHRIYAGSDFLLMPSRVEPCGLNQLYALRYGTVPIVRRTGGLVDTVVDIGDGGFGICHDQAEWWDIVHSINRAKHFYWDKEAFAKNRKKIMLIDHSWEKAAKEYIELYTSLKKTSK